MKAALQLVQLNTGYVAKTVRICTFFWQCEISKMVWLYFIDDYYLICWNGVKKIRKLDAAYLLIPTFLSKCIFNGQSKKKLLKSILCRRKVIFSIVYSNLYAEFHHWKWFRNKQSIIKEKCAGFWQVEEIGSCKNELLYECSRCVPISTGPWECVLVDSKNSKKI